MKFGLYTCDPNFGTGDGGGVAAAGSDRQLCALLTSSWATKWFFAVAFEGLNVSTPPAAESLLFSKVLSKAISAGGEYVVLRRRSSSKLKPRK